MAEEITKQSMLEEVRRAKISILQGGQAYKIGSRSLTRASLKELNDMEKQLMGEIASEESNCLMDDTFVAVFSDTR